MRKAVTATARSEGRRRRGIEGEGEAVEYLRSKGYAILERNFRSRAGEIDIIAEKGDTLAFVEVKSWSAYGEGELEYSIDGRKQRRIEQTARVFIMQRPLAGKKRFRFDVILMTGGDSRKRVRHIENAFSGVMG